MENENESDTRNSGDEGLESGFGYSPKPRPAFKSKYKYFPLVGDPFPKGLSDIYAKIEHEFSLRPGLKDYLLAS
jgi:hypothetical protein